MSESYEMTDVVWGRATRVFHWINVLCVLGLIVLGLAILNEKSFGVSADGKILLKTLHSYVGYVFALNLLVRVMIAFTGHKNSRWRAFLPSYRGYLADLKSQLVGRELSTAKADRVHNPLGRLMITALLILLLTQATTGLVLAGTDLYQPPFGSAIAEWVTGGDATRLENLKPGSKEHVIESAYADMRKVRKPYVTVHLYVFYTLLILIGLHVCGVVIGERKEGLGLISSMITGRRPRQSDN